MRPKIVQNKSLSTSIKKRNPIKEAQSADHLKQQLILIEQEISEITSSLINAKAVSFRSSISRNNNWLANLQQNMVISAANKSAKWHEDRLISLHKEHKRLKILLEKVTGKFWSNEIRRWLALISITLIGLSIIGLMLMGLMTVLYLLPIWGSILIIFLLIKQKSPRTY